MSYELWKVVHLFGILLLFVSLGGLAALTAAGRSAEGRLYRALHGIALVVVLVAGFALLGTLGMSAPGTWGTWVWIKVGVWLALGASLVLVRRVRNAAWLVVALPVLGALAAWAAFVKP